MLVRVKDAGSIGLNRDLSVHELPLGAWTDVQNIRFLDGYAHQFYGHGEVYNSPSIVPYHLLPCVIGTARYWIYASLEKIYAVTITAGSAVHTNLTRQTAAVDVDYVATANSWTSTLLGGIPILNPGNTTDPPQQWDLNTANNFQALTAWPANTYCKSMRSYKNFLIALNITDTGINYPFMVKWSSPAVPGAVPSSWDETDPTTDAGQFDLAQGYDPIVDGMALRDSFIVYKEASVWRLDYIGGQNIFQSQQVLGMSGALNRNCIVEVDGLHLVLTGSDVVLHDGQSPTSILDKYTRRWLFQNIDVDAVDHCFVFKNPFYNEVFICFPSIGATACDSAIVYNYVDRTVAHRELPNVYHASFGPIDSGLTGNWSQDPDPWDSDLTLWDGPDRVPSTSRALMGAAATKLYMLDAAASFDGTMPNAFMERKGLSFDVPEKIKLVRGIRPRIVGNTGNTIIIKIGYQNDPYEDPTWVSTMTHTIGTTIENQCFVSGRYIAVRFQSDTAYNWRVDSYELDVQISGEW